MKELEGLRVRLEKEKLIDNLLDQLNDGINNYLTNCGKYVCMVIGVNLKWGHRDFPFKDVVKIDGLDVRRGIAYDNVYECVYGLKTGFTKFFLFDEVVYFNRYSSCNNFYVDYPQSHLMRYKVPPQNIYDAIDAVDVANKEMLTKIDNAIK